MERLIKDLLQEVSRQLINISDAPELDARWLLAKVLEKEDNWVLTHGDTPLSLEQQAKFAELAQERATGKPLAYILVEWDFYGRKFLMNTSVLVPRPETEDLVEAALNHIDKNGAQAVADIGTGSGCIAITLVLERPHLTVLATDISPTALETARQNAKRHGVLDKIEFLQGDTLKPLVGKQVDLIVSNPPYLPSAEAKENKFEPTIALDGGKDGQVFIDQIKASGRPAAIEVTGGTIEVV